MIAPDQPLVSVVTPVYNGEQYLRECIESVLKQRYENWEYVIVDNKSTDKTSAIAEEYAQEETRIRVIRPQNFLPLVANWNRALREVSQESKYVKMVAADDFLFPECLTRMVELAEDHPNVGIVGAYRLYGNRVDLDVLPYDEWVVHGKEICRRSLLGGRYVFGSSTSVLFRADLVRARSAFFDETNFQCDEDAAYAVLRTSDFGFVHQVLTFTRRHPGALTSSYQSRIGTWIPAHLATILKYGRDYVSEEEFRQLVNDFSRRYSILLIKAALRLKAIQNPAFRVYHTSAGARLDELFAASGLRPPRTLTLLRRALLLDVASEPMQSSRAPV